MLGPSLESTSFPEFHRRSLFSSPKSSRNCTWRWAATCQIGVNTWRRESSFAFFCTEHNSTISSHTDCSSNSTNGNLAFIRGNWIKGVQFFNNILILRKIYDNISSKQQLDDRIATLYTILYVGLFWAFLSFVDKVKI